MNETTTMKIIEILTGVKKCYITHQDVTPPARAEHRHPERKRAVFLSFPEDPDTEKAWLQHLKETGLTFVVADMIVIAFCVWWKSIKKKKSVW